jgi:[lysine-biosynthesis-protein LysW]---L-2-aminoadipate ligase
MLRAMLALVAHRRHGTNALLAERGGFVVSPRTAARTLQPGDLALGRIDVRRDLGGIERGISTLRRLERRGVVVLNRADALVSMHDKLETAMRIRHVNLPHPRTAYLAPSASAAGIPLPAVVKPRFGSWGRHVHLCSTRNQLRRCLRELREEEWFTQQGALVQELVPPPGRDLRVLVAGGEVIGAVERVAAQGEWRTNVALGGTRRPARPNARARSLALAAAAAVGADLVGVDLLPLAGGGYSILELNGAVDFTAEYALDERDVFALAVDALARRSLPQAA